MIINVTQEDIEKGSIGNPFECPVCLAIQREYPYLSFVRVSLCQLELGLFELDRVIPIPIELTEWIQRWDNGEQCNSMEWEIADEKIEWLS